MDNQFRHQVIEFERILQEWDTWFADNYCQNQDSDFVTRYFVPSNATYIPFVASIAREYNEDGTLKETEFSFSRGSTQVVDFREIENNPTYSRSNLERVFSEARKVSMADGLFESLSNRKDFHGRPVVVEYSPFDVETFRHANVTLYMKHGAFLRSITLRKGPNKDPLFYEREANKWYIGAWDKPIEVATEELQNCRDYFNSAANVSKNLLQRIANDMFNQ